MILRRPDRSGAFLISFLVLTFLATGCAYVPLPPLSPQLGVQNLEPDENALWKESRELQHEIGISGLEFQDAALDAYMDQVLARVAPPELAASGVRPRVRVISDVNFNGYSFANGVIYLHTSLLSRMRDETQLATVLSREMAHVVNRHALRAKRDKKLQADTLAWVGVGASLIENGGNYKLLIQAASISSAVGFHHYLETAADKKGIESLAAAGYPVGETPAFFQMTVDHLAEVHGQGPWGWVPFGAPPAMVARIAGYKQLIATDYPNQTATRAPIADPAGFRRKVNGATLRQAELELAAGLFYSAEETARLSTKANPRDGRGFTLLGRALSGQRTKPLPGKTMASIQSVREAFDRALVLDPRNADAMRELALTYYRKTGTTRSAEASAESLRFFRKYLRTKPQAEDAEYIRGYIRELESEAR